MQFFIVLHSFYYLSDNGNIIRFGACFPFRIIYYTIQATHSIVP